MMKKRVKKLKNKILSKGIEYETVKKKNETNHGNNSNNLKSKLPKLIKELDKLISSTDRITSLDRNCGEINRLLQKNINDLNVFNNNQGSSVCIRLLESLSTSNESNSSKSIINLLSLLITVCKSSYDSCIDMILSNKMLSLLEMLNCNSPVMINELVSVDSNNSVNSNSSTNSNGGNNKTSYKLSNEWTICLNLIHLIGTIFSTVNSESQTATLNGSFDQNSFNQRANDLIR